ncbi:MAG TPA: MFS transporter [Acidimicrobiales bacterium]|nr:MFS transporter [Acidimicrobiales bacterium]
MLTASALSNLADGVFQVALPLLAVTLTRSPGLVAGVTLAQRIPWLVMALPAGALADRLDRKRTMIRVDLLRVVVMGAIAVTVAADVDSIAVLYVAALVLGIGETLFDTAAQSILPSVVSRDQLSEANGRLQAVELVANAFVGPPVGGLLAAAALTSAFAVSSGAYLVAALLLVGIVGSFRPQPTGEAKNMRREIAEGLRFVWHNDVLRTLGIMLGVTNLAFTAQQSVLVIYATGEMGLSEAGYGLVLTSAALGGIAGSWAGPRLERSLGRARCLVLAISLFGATLGVPAITADVAANVVAFVVASFGSVVWNVITVSFRQRITPDRLMGRMNSAYRLLGWGTMPIGAALGGVIAEIWGLRPTFAVAALLHVPLLLGFFVVTEKRMNETDTVTAT